jgi:hypothetical protein
MSRDYYPLVEGRALEYDLRDAEGDATLRVEVVSVERSGEETNAKLRRVLTRAGHSEPLDYTARKDKRAVSTSLWGQEFPLPLTAGKSWRRYPNEYKIESLDSKTPTPAGEFSGCLEVSFLVAGGDAGGGRRFYAPGVGLVRSESSDEGDAFELKLARIY